MPSANVNNLRRIQIPDQKTSRTQRTTVCDRTNEQPNERTAEKKRGMRRAGEGYGRLVPNERWAQGVSGYSERTIGDPPSQPYLTRWRLHLRRALETPQQHGGSRTTSGPLPARTNTNGAAFAHILEGVANDAISERVPHKRTISEEDR